MISNPAADYFSHPPPLLYGTNYTACLRGTIRTLNQRRRPWMRGRQASVRAFLDILVNNRADPPPALG